MFYSDKLSHSIRFFEIIIKSGCVIIKKKRSGKEPPRYREHEIRTIFLK